MCGKNFYIYGVRIPGKCTESRHTSVLHSKLHAEFFENLFPATAERGRGGRGGGENYDLLYQN